MQGRITVYLLAPGDRPNWQAQWIDPQTGARRTRSLGTDDNAEADRRRADLEYELNNGLASAPGRTTWADLRRAYELERMPEHREGSRVIWRRVANRFEAEARPTRADQITARTISQHQARLRASGLAVASVIQHLAYLKAALRWAARQELIQRMPRIDLPASPAAPFIRALTEAQYRQLRAGLPSAAWRMLVDLGWYAGLRRAEAMTLRWDASKDAPWVDLRAARIMIPAAACKAGRYDWLPIHADLGAILGEVCEPRGLVCDFVPAISPQRASALFPGLAAAVGVPCTIHDLRRSFGTRYARVVPAQVLQRLMRHQSITTTLRYYVDQDQGLEDAIGRA